MMMMKIIIIIIKKNYIKAGQGLLGKNKVPVGEAGDMIESNGVSNDKN